MKRYIIVNEFFGLKLYDNIKKKEFYFSNNYKNIVKEILEGNYIEINNNRKDGYGLSTPLKISMNITKKCNLNCEHCFSDSGKELNTELTKNEIYKIFDEMRENGTFFICIGGGEPFVRKDLLEILDYGIKKQLAISLVSNGLLITNELVQELNQKELDTIWISLDGLERTHELIRGNGTFKKTMAALQILQKTYRSKKGIKVTLNKYNIGEYQKLINIAEELKVNFIRFTTLLPYGRAKDKGLTISQDQYINFLSEIQQIKSSVEIMHPNKTNNSKFWVNSNDFGCHCGKESVWIDEIGGFYPCFFWGEYYYLGSIKNSSLEELWKKSLNITNFNGNETCKKCYNYSNCRGGCRVRVLDELGNLDDVDPLCPLKKNVASKSKL